MLHEKGWKARKMIAQGEASLRATPWVNRPQNLQALKGRKKTAPTGLTYRAVVARVFLITARCRGRPAV